MLRVAILFLFVSTLFAQEPTRLELKAEELPTPGTYWYGVYLMKAKIGGVKEYAGRTKDGRVFIAHEMQMQIRGPGGVQRMQMNQRLVFDAAPPYRLYSAVDRNDMGGGVTQTSLERTENGFRATINAAGEGRTVDLQLDFTLADQAGIEIWLRRGRAKVGDKFATRSIDMKDLEVGTDTVVLKEIRETLVRGVRQRIYIGHASSSTLGELGMVRATSSGKLISMALGGAVEIRREPEAIAKRLDANHDMFALTTVPVDKPLGDPTTIAELVLEVSGEGSGNIKSGPRQTVVAGEAPNTIVLKTGAGHAVESKPTAEDTKAALKATREYPAKDEQVVTMAREAIGDAVTARDKVARLVSFVADYVKDEYGAEYPTAKDVIRAKRGDCSAHATLFVALARALAVPAREVSGFVYIGDEARALGGHSWCEVILDGRWVEVDPTLNEMEINPTHISIRGPHGDMNMLRVLGRVSLRLASVKRK